MELPLYTVTIFFFDLDKQEDFIQSFSVNAYNDHEAGEQAMSKMKAKYGERYSLTDMKIKMVSSSKIKSQISIGEVNEYLAQTEFN